MFAHEVKRKQIQGVTSSPQLILEQFEKLPFIHSEKSREELEKTLGNQETLTEELFRMAKEEAFNIPRRKPTAEQHREYDGQREEEERRRERENEAKRREYEINGKLN